MSIYDKINNMAKKVKNEEILDERLKKRIARIDNRIAMATKNGYTNMVKRLEQRKSMILKNSGLELKK